MAFTLKATLADGTQQDVSIDAIPDAVISEAVKGKYVPKDGIEAELNRRVTGIIANKGLKAPDELLDDETFIARVLEKHPPKGDGGGDIEARVSAAVAKRLETARADWEAKTLTPVKTGLDAAGSRITRLEQQRLHGEITAQAAALGVKKAMLKPTAPGKPAPIVAMFADVFGLHVETDAYYRRDGDGFAFSDKPTKDRPFETVAEAMAKWAADKENADFLDAQQQGGPDLGGSLVSGGGKDVVLSHEEASDAATYAKAVDVATKRGGYVRVKQPPQQQW